MDPEDYERYGGVREKSPFLFPGLENIIKTQVNSTPKHAKTIRVLTFCRSDLRSPFPRKLLDSSAVFWNYEEFRLTLRMSS
jgi:hypothetical protein